MPLDDAERAFLANEWRWLEDSDAGIRTRHPGAHEAEYGSAFNDAAGAQVCLDIVVAATGEGKRLRVVTVAGLPPLSFKGKPPMVRLFYDRFGGDLVTGELMMVEQAAKDYGLERTTLYLAGAV
jgi:hypothetical protein